ncbi:MAG: phage holin family protein [Cyanobacteria bacterium P01_G01_bin.54]
MLEFLLITAITTASLLIISKLPLGIYIESLNKALIAGVVLGLLNGAAHFVFGLIEAVPLLGGLVTVVVNLITFSLAAWLVRGFDLKWGFMSALLGSIALSFFNTLIASFF